MTVGLFERYNRNQTESVSVLGIDAVFDLCDIGYQLIRFYSELTEVRVSVATSSVFLHRSVIQNKLTKGSSGGTNPARL